MIATPGRRRVLRRAATTLVAALAVPLLAVTPAHAADGYTFTPLQCTPLHAAAFDAEVSRSGYSALVAGDGFVSKVDVTANPAKVLGTSTAAFGDEVAIHPNRVVGYVADNTTGTIFVLSISGNRPVVVRTINVPNVHDIAVAPDGRYLYVVNLDYGSASYFRVYSLAKPTAPARIFSLRLPYSGESVAVAPGGTSAAVTMSNRLAIVRLANPKVPTVAASVALPFYAGPVTYSRDGAAIFAGSTIRPQFSRIDLASRHIVVTRSIGQVSDKVDDLEVSSDNKLIWVATNSTHDENSIYAFGIASGQVHFLGSGIDYPNALSMSAAGASKGRIYIPSRLASTPMCGVKQAPN